MRPTLKDFLVMGGEALAVRCGRGPFPLTLYVALTDRCPMRCIYCAVPRRQQRDLPTDLVLQMVREAADLGMKRLQLVGGEPLMAPDLGAVVETANRHGVFVTLTTGGTLIAEQMAALTGVDLVFVSLDGDAQVHDTHRGAGTHAQVMAGLDRLTAAGVPFWTTTVVTRLNHDKLEAVVDLARVRGHQANFQLLYTTGDGFERHFHPSSLPKLALNHDEARRVIARLRRWKKDGAPIGSSTAYFDYLLGWPDLNRVYGHRENGGPHCMAGRLYAYLDTDGRLYPCGDAVGRTPGADVTGPGGLATALEELGPQPCGACIVACNVEQNLLFAFHPRTVVNWLRRL